MLPLRLVIDNNVLISAALKPGGLQRTTFLLAITKPARLYVTRPILEEYADVLSRPELRIRKGLRCSWCSSSKTAATSSYPHAAWTCAVTRTTMSFLNALTRRVPITLLQAIAGIFLSSGRRPKSSRPVNSSVLRHPI